LPHFTVGDGGIAQHTGDRQPEAAIDGADSPTATPDSANAIPKGRTSAAGAASA
jgi:hypothetical protein